MIPLTCHDEAYSFCQKLLCTLADFKPRIGVGVGVGVGVSVGLGVGVGVGVTIIMI